MTGGRKQKVTTGPHQGTGKGEKEEQRNEKYPPETASCPEDQGIPEKVDSQFSEQFPPQLTNRKPKDKQ